MHCTRAGALGALTVQTLSKRCRSFGSAAKSSDLYDVAIVGAGLTGAALAAGLGALDLYDP